MNVSKKLRLSPLVTLCLAKGDNETDFGTASIVINP